jgi:hypothetical protein
MPGGGGLALARSSLRKGGRKKKGVHKVNNTGPALPGLHALRSSLLLPATPSSDPGRRPERGETGLSAARHAVRCATAHRTSRHVGRATVALALSVRA